MLNLNIRSKRGLRLEYLVMGTSHIVMLSSTYNVFIKKQRIIDHTFYSVQCYVCALKLDNVRKFPHCCNYKSPYQIKKGSQHAMKTPVNQTNRKGEKETFRLHARTCMLSSAFQTFLDRGTLDTPGVHSWVLRCTL